MGPNRKDAYGIAGAAPGTGSPDWMVARRGAEVGRAEGLSNGI